MHSPALIDAGALSSNRIGSRQERASSEGSDLDALQIRALAFGSFPCVTIPMLYVLRGVLRNVPKTFAFRPRANDFLSVGSAQKSRLSQSILHTRRRFVKKFLCKSWMIERSHRTSLKNPRQDLRQFHCHQNRARVRCAPTIPPAHRSGDACTHRAARALEISPRSAGG